MPRRPYDSDEHEYGHEGGRAVGIFDRGAAPWSRELRNDPHKQKGFPDVESSVEAQDEIRWGDAESVVIDAPGTGIFAADLPQMIQATRPARAWTADFSFSLPGVTALPTLPDFEVTVTFIVILGLGSSRITKYFQLFSADLVGFAPDPQFPLRLSTPIVSAVETNFPARQLIVGAHIEYQRILLAAPAQMQVLVQAALAPVIR
jgi:hypothetical protein